AGAVLISALTSSFFSGIEDNPAIPEELSSSAQVELASGVPFIPDDDLSQALADAGIKGETATAIVDENEEARLNGLRAALAVLALIALVALFLSYGVPTRQPSAEK
ncbi:MAG: MFS transporter, partial [Nocardioidaceae bacterium]